MGEVVPMAGRVVSLAQIGRIEEQENPQMARSRNSNRSRRLIKCERFWTLPETGIGRARQGKRKDDCQLVLDGQNPRGLHSIPTVLASSSQFRAIVALAGRVSRQPTPALLANGGT
jgi:hypothetical protein